MITASEKDGRRVVTATIHGRDFSFYNRCTHFPDCDLSKGRLSGNTIICTCGWQYDLLTGRGVNHPVASIEKLEEQRPCK
jgi:nitrite reductase/ring-hydroxylating ferredoxin subunit